MVSYNHYNYSQYWARRHYEDAAERITLERLLRITTPKNSLIDIGAGYGRLFSTYAPFFKKLTLVEPSQKLLAKAKHILPRRPNLRIIKGRAQNLPVSSRNYDVALMVRVSHHLNDLRFPFEEIYRILKPQGYLILEFPNKVNFKASLRAIFARRFSFFSHLPVNLSGKNEARFVNYHPNQILTMLQANGFKIIKTVSVSNFRLKIFKTLVPPSILLFLETYFSLLTSSCSTLKFFGPSIFILAQKHTKN